MALRFRPNRLDAFAVVALILTTVLFLEPALDAADVYTSYQAMSAGAQVVAVFGWVIATFGPITASVAAWRWCKGRRRAWIVHLLLLPSSYAMFVGGAELILGATGDRTGFDNTLGGPILQAMFLLLLAVVGYYSAVLHGVYKRMRRKGIPAKRPIADAS